MKKQTNLHIVCPKGEYIFRKFKFCSEPLRMSNDNIDAFLSNLSVIPSELMQKNNPKTTAFKTCEA